MLKGREPGKLDKRITLQSRTTAANAYGEPVETWADVADVWAEVNYPLTQSGEVYIERVNIATTNTEFTIRYRADVGFDWRIVYGSDSYDIERISEVGRQNYLTISAKRRL